MPSHFLFNWQRFFVTRNMDRGRVYIMLRATYYIYNALHMNYIMQWIAIYRTYTVFICNCRRMYVWEHKNEEEVIFQYAAFCLGNGCQNGRLGQTDGWFDLTLFIIPIWIYKRYQTRHEPRHQQKQTTNK